VATKKSALTQPTTAAKTAKDEVDSQLARYREMRDFSTTAEPSGGSAKPAVPKTGLPFVIQKHAATRLHYDFRLGWHGVLKSWACAKGPSYNTHDKRLAVEVEDHPMEYGGFEGTIPKGQYGGGTVMVWDQGTWEPLAGTDVDEGLRKGSLKFTLHGHKLEGRWTLVRMGGRAANESKPNWLLIKEHDGNERPDGAPAITDEAPDSVVTGRSLEQIAAAEDHVWNSRPAEHAATGGTGPANHSRLQQKLKNAHLQVDCPRQSTCACIGKLSQARDKADGKAHRAGRGAGNRAEHGYRMAGECPPGSNAGLHPASARDSGRKDPRELRLAARTQTRWVPYAGACCG